MITRRTSAAIGPPWVESSPWLKGGKRMLGGSVGPIQIDLRLRVGTPVDLIEIDTASVVATIDRQPVGSDKPPKSHGHNGDGDTSSNLRARFHIEATGPDRFGKSTSASGRMRTFGFR